MHRLCLAVVVALFAASAHAAEPAKSECPKECAARAKAAFAFAALKAEAQKSTVAPMPKPAAPKTGAQVGCICKPHKAGTPWPDANNCGSYLCPANGGAGCDCCKALVNKCPCGLGCPCDNGKPCSCGAFCSCKKCPIKPATGITAGVIAAKPATAPVVAAPQYREVWYTDGRRTWKQLELVGECPGGVCPLPR